MPKKLKSLILILAALLIALVWQTAKQPAPPPASAPAAESAAAAQHPAAPGKQEETAEIAEDGVYTSARDVAGYLIAYGRLPRNFITKAEARKLSWSGGDLRPYAKDACIGGDRFGNYEGRLPEKEGRIYRECDIDTLGQASRGAKRLVYSSDGLIYYSQDHYESFVLLYGEDQHAAN